MKQAAEAVWMSFVRTIVPVAVSAVVAWLTTMGLELDPELATNLGILFTAVLTGVYYLVVRLLETYVSPKFGWLLGSNKSPDSYSTTEVPK